MQWQDLDVINSFMAQRADVGVTHTTANTELSADTRIVQPLPMNSCLGSPCTSQEINTEAHKSVHRNLKHFSTPSSLLVLSNSLNRQNSTCVLINVLNLRYPLSETAASSEKDMGAAGSRKRKTMFST